MAARRLQVLNNKHLAYILFKIGGFENKQICDILKVQPTTLTAWGKDLHIREVREQVEEDIGTSARQYIQSLLPEAIFTMADVMRNGKSERSRLDAASRILDKAMPQELVQKHIGDPNAPILHALLKSEDDQRAHAALHELTPEERADMAATIEKLESFASAGATSEDA